MNCYIRYEPINNVHVSGVMVILVRVQIRENSLYIYIYEILLLFLLMITHQCVNQLYFSLLIIVHAILFIIYIFIETCMYFYLNDT